IGPASSSKEMLEKLINEGVNVVRVNFSHGSYDDHNKVIQNIRQINKEYSIHTAILADLQGPKIRIGDVENGKISVKKGEEISFVTDIKKAGQDKIFINYLNFPKDVEAGEKILIDDGKLSLKIIETNNID